MVCNLHRKGRATPEPCLSGGRRQLVAWRISQWTGKCGVAWWSFSRCAGSDQVESWPRGRSWVQISVQELNTLFTGWRRQELLAKKNQTNHVLRLTEDAIIVSYISSGVNLIWITEFYFLGCFSLFHEDWRLQQNEVHTLTLTARHLTCNCSIEAKPQPQACGFTLQFTHIVDRGGMCAVSATWW